MTDDEAEASRVIEALIDAGVHEHGDLRPNGRQCMRCQRCGTPRCASCEYNTCACGRVRRVQLLWLRR